MGIKKLLRGRNGARWREGAVRMRRMTGVLVACCCRTLNG